MKRNLALIISIIAFLIAILTLLSSCTSSGKLSDAKFPFAANFEGYIANKYPLPIDPVTGAKIMGKYYLRADFTPTIPTNAGSYTVNVNPYMESTELIVAKARLKGVTIGIIIFILIGLIAFISEKIKKKKEVITLPDEFTQNYKL